MNGALSCCPHSIPSGAKFEFDGTNLLNSFFMTSPSTAKSAAWRAPTHQNIRPEPHFPTTKQCKNQSKTSTFSRFSALCANFPVPPRTGVRHKSGDCSRPESSRRAAVLWFLSAFICVHPRPIWVWTFTLGRGKSIFWPPMNADERGSDFPARFSRRVRRLVWEPRCRVAA